MFAERVGYSWCKQKMLLFGGGRLAGQKWCHLGTSLQHWHATLPKKQTTMKSLALACISTDIGIHIKDILGVGSLPRYTFQATIPFVRPVRIG